MINLNKTGHITACLKIDTKNLDGLNIKQLKNLNTLDIYYSSRSIMTKRRVWGEGRKVIAIFHKKTPTYLQ